MIFNLRLIPLLPFLGAALLMLFGRKWSRDTVVAVAVGMIAGACLVAFDAYFLALPDAGAAGLHDSVGTWIAAGPLHIDLAFQLDALSGLLCLIITFIGFLIHVYASGYMEHDPDYARFFAYLNLFCGVDAGAGPRRQPAGHVHRVGGRRPLQLPADRLLVQGQRQRRRRQEGVHHQPHRRLRLPDRDVPALPVRGDAELHGRSTMLRRPAARSRSRCAGSPVAFWAALFLFIGATGKSAQIPLYVWLPDAMAGPTPVSALIHAATMVTAGVYMVARMHALYLLSPAAMAIVAAIGALTALFAAIIGFAQNDFKKVLAYSTISQLGFMFVGVGTGNFEAGIFHLYTHAFFKAGLFLCAGSVMHAMSGSGDITIMGGLRKKIPWTHGVFFVCWLAICGVLVLLGLLLEGRHHRGRLVDRVLQGLGLGGHRRGGSCSARRARDGVLHVAPLLPGLLGRDARLARGAAPHPRVARQHGRPAGGAGHRRRGWVASSVCPAACSTTPTGTCSQELAPVLGPEMEVSHVAEIMVMGDRHRAGGDRHRRRLRLLRRRLPRAGQEVRPALPGPRAAGPGQVPHRRALPAS